MICDANTGIPGIREGRGEFLVLGQTNCWLRANRSPDVQLSCASRRMRTEITIRLTENKRISEISLLERAETNRDRCMSEEGVRNEVSRTEYVSTLHSHFFFASCNTWSILYVYIIMSYIEQQFERAPWVINETVVKNRYLYLRNELLLL